MSVASSVAPWAYVCPQCKGALLDYRCARCRLEFPLIDAIPCFLADAAGGSDQKLRAIYDDIYRHHEDVWVGQGRSQEFLNYLRELAGPAAAASRVLELGCGEGALLALLAGAERYGIDPSLRALQRARQRSAAACAVARAEQLPFPNGWFDLVVAIGVMEHFEDPAAASLEVHRVLKPSGRYIVLIQTDMTPLQRAALKLREYLFPRFRPWAALKWLRSKIHHPIVQPLRRSYTIAAARQCLEDAGLVVREIITHATHPQAPLAGAHVVILIAGPASTAGPSAGA